MKKVVLLLAAAMIFLLSGCHYKDWFGKRPCDQPNSEWISEDHTVSFSVDKNGAGTGQIITEKGIVDIHVAIGPATEVHVYQIKDRTDERIEGAPIEKWSGFFPQENQFIVTVEETSYFTVGAKITFYRVNDGLIE